MNNSMKRASIITTYKWKPIVREDLVNFEDAFIILNGFKASTGDGFLYVYKNIFGQCMFALEDTNGNIKLDLDVFFAESLYSKLQCYTTMGCYAAFSGVSDRIKRQVSMAIDFGKIKANKLVKGMSVVYDNHPEMFPVDCEDKFYVELPDSLYLLVFDGFKDAQRRTYAFDAATCSFEVFSGRIHRDIVQKVKEQVKEFSVDELSDIISKFYAYGQSNNIPVQFMPMAVHSLLNSNKDMSLEDVSALMNKLCKGGE